MADASSSPAPAAPAAAARRRAPATAAPAGPDGRRTAVAHEILAGAVGYLEAAPRVAEVRVVCRAAATESALRDWELVNRPCTIPQALRSIYLVADGLEMQWSVKTGKTSQVPVGSVCVPPLSKLVHVPRPQGSWPAGADAAGRHAFPIEEGLDGPSFVLQTTQFGTAALVYNLELASEEPCVHFLSAGKWHRITKDFGAYLRLSVAHLGIFGWHLGYTPQGLSRSTMAWMKMYAPGQLQMHIDAESEQRRRLVIQRDVDLYEGYSVELGRSKGRAGGLAGAVRVDSNGQKRPAAEIPGESSAQIKADEPLNVDYIEELARRLIVEQRRAAESKRAVERHHHETAATPAGDAHAQRRPQTAPREDAGPDGHGRSPEAADSNAARRSHRRPATSGPAQPAPGAQAAAAARRRDPVRAQT